jgi:hypothetical protein
MVTTTFFSTVVVAPSTPPGSGHSNSNDGAIIGGVAGGISLLVITLIFGLFFWRRKRSSDNPPDRVASQAGHTDLTGTEVTPYSYEPEAGYTASRRSGPTSPTWSMDDSMQQYRDSQVLLDGIGGGGFEAGVATATSGSHYAPSMSDGASARHTISGHARSNSRGSSSGHGQGASTSMALPPRRSMSVKAREAQHQNSVGLAITPEEGEEPFIQHSDGGVAVPVVASQLHEIEIPPSYDSIPGNPT